MAYGFTEIVQLIGALGLFLFGMKVMSDALLLLAGTRMRAILATMTSNRFLGVATGFMITSVIQSSSATTLMVVSFSNASLLSLTEAISVIMGANIGTTITAWLITLLGFEVSMSAIALPLVGFGFLFTFAKKERLKQWGTFIIGFAVLFIGLQFLKESMPDINAHPGLMEALSAYGRMGYGSILLFLLVGTLLTIIIQSSSATMALTLVMTAQGWISFELAAAMVLGENIGTTVTANLAAIVGNYQAKRTARAHLVFNLLGVLWMLGLFYPFLRMVAWVTGQLGGDSPFVEAAAVPVAISLFHTIFNIANTLLLIGFIKPIGRLVEWLVPQPALPEKAIDEPKYLHEKVLKYPETAIAALLDESKYLYEHAIFEIVSHAMNLHRDDILGTEKPGKMVRKSKEDFKTDVRALYLSKVKNIYGEIIRYATLAQSRLVLSEAQHSRLLQIKVANRKMVEIIRDVGDLSRNVSRFLDSPNSSIKEEYNHFRKKVVRVLRVVYRFSSGGDKEKAHRKLLALKQSTTEGIQPGNKRIERLIREDKVNSEMASSLVNDHDHLIDLIMHLIDVAELLYGNQDPLMAVAGEKGPFENAAVGSGA